MAFESFDTGSAFAETACKLIIEYISRLKAKKQEIIRILELYYTQNNSNISSSYLSRRYREERHDFEASKGVYDGLIRKVSQWLEHGKPAQPNLQMELEVRLADFEHIVQSLENFIGLYSF